MNAIKLLLHAVVSYLCLALLVNCEYEIEIVPKYALALPGQRFSVMCKVNVPIDYCQLKIPTSQYNLTTLSSFMNTIVKYNGELERGECGATIKNISDDNNGVINCTMGISYSSDEISANMTLIVSRPPKPPILTITTDQKGQHEFKVGNEITASCIVKDGRPLPKVIWYLDDEKLRSVESPIFIKESPRSGQTLIQNITRKLKLTDNGKLLKCVVKHPSLASNEEVSIELDIKFQPQPIDAPLEFFAQIKKSAMILIEFMANPKPTIEWVFNNKTLKQGRADFTLMYKADLLIDKGRGRYEARLRFISVSEKDTKTLFKLIAINPLGRTIYDVILSKVADPFNLFSNYTY